MPRREQEKTMNRTSVRSRDHRSISGASDLTQYFSYERSKVVRQSVIALRSLIDNQQSMTCLNVVVTANPVWNIY
jgi:hypothetical protein